MNIKPWKKCVHKATEDGHVGAELLHSHPCMTSVCTTVITIRAKIQVL